MSDSRSSARTEYTRHAGAGPKPVLPGRADRRIAKIGRTGDFIWAALPAAAIALLILVALAVGSVPRVAVAQTAGPELSEALPGSTGGATPMAAEDVCQPQLIYTVTTGISSQPSMSPEGNLIAFWSTGGVDGGNPDGSIELFMLDTANDSLKQLTNSHGSILGGFNLAPSFNAAGNLVVFYSDRDLVGENKDENFEIFMYHVQTGTFEQVTHTDRGVSVSPAISAQGDYVAFATDQDLTGENLDENLEIFRIRVADRALTEITFTGEGDTNDLPSISQDGNLIAFVSTADLATIQPDPAHPRHNTDGNLEVFLYVEGEGILQITNTAAQYTNDYPALSAYGTHVVYASDQEGNQRIYLYNIASGETITVTNESEGSSIYPSINGTGTLVAFASDADLTGDNPDHTLQVFLYNPNDGRMTQISDAAGGSITSYPSLSAYGADTTFIVGNHIYKTNCPEANLSIVKTATPQQVVPGLTLTDTVAAGTTLTYTLLADDLGPLNGEAVVVTDTLPPPSLVTIQSVTPGRGSCVTDTVPIRCDLGKITVAQGIPITLVVSVDPGTANGTIITNTSGIWGAVQDPDNRNNQSTVATTVAILTDMDLVKVDSPDPVYAGENLTYTLTISNGGPSSSTGATVTDTLPLSVTVTPGDVTADHATCHPPYNSLVVCDIDPLGPNEAAHVVILGQVDSGVRTELTNTARVVAWDTDLNGANNEKTVTTVVHAKADLSVDKAQPASARALAGETWPYTMTVTNNGGPSDATSVVLTDTLPISATLVSASSECSEVPGTGQVVCSLGTLAPTGAKATKVVTVTVLFDPDLRATVTNNVTVKGAEEDPDGATASAQTMVVGQADLSVLKTASSAIAGTALTYTVVVHNAGPSNARSVVLTDTLPPGISHGAADPSQGSCTGVSDTVTCSLGTIGAGQNATVTIPMALDPSLRGTIQNRAEVSTIESDPPGNNQDILDTVVTGEADLWVTKTADQDRVVAGTQLTYALVVTNNGGPSDATGIVLTDTLPPGTSFVFASAGCNGTPGSADPVTCTIGDLQPGASTSVIIVVDVDASTTGTIHNEATATSAEFDPVSSNDSPFLDTAVDVEVDLKIQKLDDPDPVVAGATLTYTLNYTNDGPSDAQNVCITDTLDSKVTFGGVVQQPPPGWTESPPLTWCTPTLAANANGTIVFTTTVDSDTPAGLAMLWNHVTITTTTPETYAADNDVRVSTDVTTEADVSVVKDADPNPVAAGERLTYTVTVHNSGPSDAQGVLVTDTLPGGTSFASATQGYNITTIPLGEVLVSWDLGTMPAGTAAATEVLTLVVDIDPSATQRITNTVDVTTTTPGTGLPGSHFELGVDVQPTADLGVAKLQEPAQVVAGGILTYTLIYTNHGPSNAWGTTITDTLSDQVAWGGVVSQPLGWGSSPTYTAGPPATLVWYAPTLAPNVSGTIVFTVAVNSVVEHVFSNTVQIASASLDPGPTPNQDSVTAIIEADLAIGKYSVPATPTPGKEFAYWITVTNSSASRIVGAVVYDLVPSDFKTNKSLTWNCSTSTASSTCHAPSSGLQLNDDVTLDAGGRITYTLTGTLKGKNELPDPLVNTATVTVPAWVTDPNTDNNTALYSESLAPTADLVVAKTVNNSRPSAGNSITYTVAVTNADATQSAEKPTVTDTLPAGLTCVQGGAVPSRGTVSWSGSSVTWDLWGSPGPSDDYLAAGGTATLTIRCTVNAGTAGTTIVNTAYVSAVTADELLGNNASAITFTVNIPPVASGDTYTVGEDARLQVPAGTGVLSNDTDDDGDTLTVVAVEGDALTSGSPVILSSGAVLTMTQDGAFDYDPNGQFEWLAAGAETTDPFTYTLDDGYGGTAWATVTLTITGENDAPTDISLTDNSVPENAAAGTVVGTFSTADVDSTDSFTYTLATGGDDNDSFAIDGNALKTAAVFDYETKSIYHILVQTEDSGGLTYEKPFTITVSDVNDPPTDIHLSNESVAENEPVGTAVGTFSTTDIDSSAPFTYSLVSGVGSDDNGSFTVAGSVLETAAVFDYETKSSYHIRVQTEDSGHLTFQKPFTITVTDVNEAPWFASTAPTSVNEGELYTYDVLADDPDNGDSLTITAPVIPAWLTLTDHGGGTATLSGTPAADGAGEYPVELEVRDTAGLTATQAFSLTVIRVNDVPQANPDTYSTTEDALLPVPALTGVLSNDVDLDHDVLTVTAVNGMAFAVQMSTTLLNGAVLTMTDSGAFDYDPVGHFDYLAAGVEVTDTFTYTVSDAESSAWTTVTVTITGVNDAPVANNDTATAVWGRLRIVDVLANDSDVDTDPGSLYVSAVGPASPGVASIGVASATVVYSPTHFTGTDIFTYTVSDGDLTDVGTVTVDVVPFTVTISGPPGGVIPDQRAPFTATVEFTATTPLTFTWIASEQTTPTIVHEGVDALMDTVVYTWTAGASPVVTVTVANNDGSAASMWSASGAGGMSIIPSIRPRGDQWIYLPLVVRQW